MAANRDTGKLSLVQTDACTGGADTSYQNGHCRCDGCRALNSAYRKRKYYERHEENKAKMRGAYAKAKDSHLNYKLERAYGITKAQWYEIFEAQEGVCAICKSQADVSAPGVADRTLHVDHCHETGRVRGLLCGPCNRAIGLLKDSAAIAYAAAEYLE